MPSAQDIARDILAGLFGPHEIAAMLSPEGLLFDGCLVWVVDDVVRVWAGNYVDPDMADLGEWPMFKQRKPSTLTLTVNVTGDAQALDVIDSLNTVLRSLVDADKVDDADDRGWSWSQ